MQLLISFRCLLQFKYIWNAWPVVCPTHTFQCYTRANAFCSHNHRSPKLPEWRYGNSVEMERALVGLNSIQIRLNLLSQGPSEIAHYLSRCNKGRFTSFCVPSDKMHLHFSEYGQNKWISVNPAAGRNVFALLFIRTLDLSVLAKRVALINFLIKAALELKFT